MTDMYDNEMVYYFNKGIGIDLIYYICQMILYFYTIYGYFYMIITFFVIFTKNISYKNSIFYVTFLIKIFYITFIINILYENF